MTLLERVQIAGFDLDGTLVDSVRTSYETNCLVIPRFGGAAPDYEEFRRALTCFRDWSSFFSQFGVPAEETEKILEAYYEIEYVSHFNAINGSIETLERIQQKAIPLFLVTTNPSRENVFKRMRDSKIEKFFSLEEVYNGESSAKETSIREAVLKRGIEPSSAIFVGDTKNDMLQAKSAGVISIGIANEFSYNPRDMILEANPDYVLQNIKDLLSLE